MATPTIAKKMGLKVQFLYMGASANGWIENGTIYLCLDAERAMQFVFGHEMTHAIKQANPSAYRELVKVAASIMTDEEWDKQVAANQAKYRGMAGYNTADDIVEEVVADALGKFVDDFDLAKRFALKLSHPVLASVIQAIRDIKNLLLGAPYRQLESLEKIVENAYVETARGTFESNATGGERFSLREKEVNETNERFNRELQEQIDGKQEKGHIYHLGTPSAVLLSTGVPNLPIHLNAARLKVKATQFDHDFDLNEIKGLVKAIQNPIAIFAYGDKEKAQNIILELSKDGKNFIVGLSLNPFVGGKHLYINSIRNVFPKDNSEWLNWISQGKTLYLDKGKIQTLIDQQRTNLADVDYLDLDSVAKVLNDFENPKVSEENLQKSEEKASAMPKTLEEFLASPKLKFSIKTEEERKAAQNAYDYAMSLRPDKWKQYALVNMKNPNQAPTYYEKKEFADKWRVYANRIWKDNTDFKLFDLDKPFEEQVMNVKGKVPTEFEPQKSKEKEGIAHRQKLRREMDIADATIDRLNRKSREDFNDFIEKYAAEHGLTNKYDVPYEVWQEAQSNISAKYDAQKDALLEKLNSLKEEMGNIAAKFSLQDGKTLVGVHNISEDKLRKAIKQGGLANPSVAVIDMSKQAHEGYGEISLIMPSEKIAKRTGRNVGTWQGDAWTPTYPQVERQMDRKGSEKASEDVMSVPREMQGRVRMGMNAWLDNGNDTSGMTYMFLHERNEAPEMKTTPSKYSEDTYNELRHITAGDFNLFGIGKADTEKVIDLYVKEKYGGDRAAYEDGLRNWVEKNKKAAAEDKGGLRKAIALQNLDIYGEHGFNYKSVQSFVRDVKYDHRKGGKADIDGAMRASDEYVKSQGLQDEFNKWLEEKEKQYGIKEVIFDGFTPSGKRRYVDNTLENVSKLMKKQGRNGASGLGFSFNNFAAKLMPSYGKLSDIRSKKNLLTSDHEKLDKFREKWGNVFFELGKKCQPDAENPFDDYGMERLAEAALQKDPQAYLKKEYNVDFSDADLEKLNDMIKAIKEEYPAMYFETKFERPVGLEEFKAAVVPSTIANGMKESLQEAGLPLYEYDRTKEGDRKRAFEEAVGASDDVRFSINTYHGSAAGFDRFDHSHMGEGEGAQAYGWGTYVTEVEGIGRTYAENNTRNKFGETITNYVYKGDTKGISKQDLDDIIEMAFDSKPASTDGVRREFADWLEFMSTKHDTYYSRLYNVAKRLAPEQFFIEKSHPERHLYTVEIPDDTGDNYLEWDKKYTQKETDNLLEKLFDAAKDNDEQMEAVQEFSNWLLDDEVRSKDFYQDAYGRSIYNKLTECLGGSDRKASELLHKAGFTGVKVIAQRNTGGNKDGKMNYVIFNEGDAKIVEHTRFSLKNNQKEGDEKGYLDAISTLYLKGKTYAEKLFSMKFFDVAKTPDFMKQYGLTGDKFTVRYGVLSRHFGKDGSHDFTEEEWKQLPNALQNPFAISKLEGKKNGYRIYTTLKTEKGEYVVVGADVKNGGRNMELNAISTIFGRRKNANLSEKELVVYKSKEITPEQMALLSQPNSDQYPSSQELKAQSNLHLAAPIAAVSNTNKLDSAAKIVKGFDNSKENAENSSSKDVKFSLRHDDYEEQLEQWKKDNGLPKDAQRPTLPIRNAGESATDYMARVQQYRKEMALWKTAPTYETHLLDSDKAQGIYNRELQRGSVLRRIAVQDSMLAIRKAQEAIMREHGAAINMAEDAYTAENRSHGKGKNAHNMYHPNDNVGIFPYAIRENP